ncbi:MAG: UMP kinase [Methanocellales archaeon]
MYSTTYIWIPLQGGIGLKIVISIGGSIIAQEINAERFAEYARVIKKIAKKHKVAVVTGGGAIARNYINAARKLGADEASCDLIGIEVTRLNARLLISALHPDVYPQPALDYKEAESALSSRRIVVMGGVAPGQTTDAVAAILAEHLKADLLVNATSVDGIYSADPRLDPKARKFDKLSPRELVEIAMKVEMKAGSKFPIDPLGAKIIERSNIPTIVLNGINPQNILDAILLKKKIGTVIRNSH